MFENKEMRAVLFDFLNETMKVNPRVVVLDADLGKANGTYNLRNNYPSYYNLNDYGLSTFPEAQGSLGLCWAFATNAQAESLLLIQNNKTYNNNVIENSNELTLYIEIGTGKGSNWWGTVYPEFLIVSSSEVMEYESIFVNIFKNLSGYAQQYLYDYMLNIKKLMKILILNPK